MTFLSHFLRHQRKYLASLALAILLVPLLVNFFLKRSLLYGGETFFLLQKGGIPPTPPLIVLPPLLGIVTVLLFHSVLRKCALPPLWAVSSSVLLLLTPAFIFTYTTFSLGGLFVLVTLAALRSSFSRYRRLSLLFLLPAAFLDLLSTGILSALLILRNRQAKGRTLLLTGVSSAAAVLLALFLHRPLVRGPFSLSHSGFDLFSDLGGQSGISIFTLLLAVLGVGILWKERKHQGLLLLFLVVLGLAGAFPSAGILLSLPVAVLGAYGLVSLWERRWQRSLLKDFTLMLILVSVLLSALTFLKRLPVESPSLEELETLRWIRDYTPQDAVVFSASENSYLIETYAERKAVFPPDHKESAALTSELLHAAYTSTAFPLLEAHHISVLFITPTLRSSPPWGLFLLFKNERFKLAYSHEGFEVWFFSLTEVPPENLSED